MMLGSAGMYVVNHQIVSELFAKLGYPSYLVYPLAIAKILGVLAILTKKSKLLKDWSYAGFFYGFMLAAAAHYFSGVPSPLMAIIAIILLIASYTMDKKIYG